MRNANTPLVVIVGPTASGKSALGINIAVQFGGEVIVCDSTQVYRRFDIGTAKVPPAAQHGVPHHLIDLVDPHEVFTAGEYRKRALTVLEDLRRRRRLPVITAGTGLYLRALLEGLSDAPTRSEELRARLRASESRHKPGYLHKLLARLDPEAAARIAPADTPKLIRAIEVCLLAGRPITELHRAGRPRLEGFTVIKLGLQPPRTALYERIERRVAEMIESGWLQEVKQLLAVGIEPTAKPFQFIGYRELAAHLAGHYPLAKTVETIQRNTRRYAKRQLTWFRREPGVRWFSGFGDDPAIATAALDFLRSQLAQYSASQGATGRV
jgi:tRNA dimethylallyltransferase